MAQALWQLDSVTLDGSPSPRLCDVSLTVRGPVTAVIGPSGCGKTSLLNLLVGYARPSRGAVRRVMANHDGRLPVYWSPQTHGLWGHLTVREHLLEVATPTPEQAAMGQIDALIEQAGLGDVADALPGRLSQGQRARLALIRALASDARVLVLDEPLVHVDPSMAERCMEMIHRHVAERGCSLVMATHEPARVLGDATDVICLDEGRVVFTGEVDELYWRPASERLARYLGEANWLTPEHAKLWLGRTVDGPMCYRPEQLSVEPAENGPIVVTQSRFGGSVEQVEVRHEPTGETRRFYHRPPTPRLRRGQRVVIRLLMVWWSIVACTGMAGCGSGDDPRINVASVKVWPIPAVGTRAPSPRTLAMGQGDEVIMLDTAGRVVVYDTSGQVLRQWEMPAYDVGKPEGVTVMQDGRIAVADTHYSRVVIFDSQGKVLSMFGENGTEPGQFIYPVAIAQDERGFLYVGEYGSNDRVQKFTPEGQFVLQFGTFGTKPGQFQRASGIVWRQGVVYVADAINNRVQMFSDEGRFMGVLEKPGRPLRLELPYDIAMDLKGDLYVVEYGAGRVTKVSLEGELLGRYGSIGRSVGQFAMPWGLTVTRRGDILVADTGNHRVVELRIP